MEKTKSIHFVGVKGVGITPLAIIAKEAGIAVTGSDIAEEFITDKILSQKGIHIFKGFSKSHVDDVGLVITTGAHGGFDNEEVIYAKKKGIPVISQGEAVGKFMQGEYIGRKPYKGISVAGSHGKTTTSALIATVLKEVGIDASYVVGTGNLIPLGAPGHFGKGEYFVAEADEYATEPTHDKTPKLFWQHPQIAVFTNIEFDHPDLYKDTQDLAKTFLEFTKNIKKDGTLVCLGDDEYIRKLIPDVTCKIVTYGFSPHNDFTIKKVSVSEEQTFFWVEFGDTQLGEFSLSITGEHNSLNGLAAIVVGLEMGIPIEKLRKVLPVFKGVQRRAEFKGTLASGVKLFDDYAHHPTEIGKTLKTFKQRFPKSIIICVFQPHTYSRTKSLFDEFVHSFSDADVAILIDIYPSLREAVDPSVSSFRLVHAMNGLHKDAIFMAQKEDVIQYITHLPNPKNSIVITMGAGDVYKIADALPLQKI